MLKLEVRPQPSKVWSYASPLLALALTVVIGIILFVCWAKTRCVVCRCFSGSPSARPTPWPTCCSRPRRCSSSHWAWRCVSAPTCGTLAPRGSLSSGRFLRRCGAAWPTRPPGRWFVVLVLLAGVAGGMLWAAVTAVLRDRFNANEILVSLMLVYVAVQVLNFLVFGPWKDPMGFNFPQTPPSRRRPRCRACSMARASISGCCWRWPGWWWCGSSVPHLLGFCAAGGRAGTGGRPVCRVLVAPGAVDWPCWSRAAWRAWRGAGSGRPDRPAHAFCARRLRFCRHHRGLCRAPAPGGHRVFGPADEHVLHRG
jgi:hypothetical protein